MTHHRHMCLFLLLFLLPPIVQAWNNNNKPSPFSFFTKQRPSRRSFRNDPDDNEQQQEDSRKEQQQARVFDWQQILGNSINVPFKPNKQAKAARRRVVTDMQELHKAIFEDRLPLSSLDYVKHTANNRTQVRIEALQHHAVVQAMVQRHYQKSRPGHRQKDDNNNTIILAMEGGGMRGCVAAGMAAALAALDLLDSVDGIAGSSAGSVIGAYLVSRQVCMDVYVDILPRSKSSFVCLQRLAKSVGRHAWQVLLMDQQRNVTSLQQEQSFDTPGMNISFVLDGILHPETGLRPLDVQSFWTNAHVQPLYIAATRVDAGRETIGTHVFSSTDMNNNNNNATTALFQALQASMTVPGAAGPPVPIMDNDDDDGDYSYYLDAFGTQPLPYRSVVYDDDEINATHILALASRPADYVAATQPTLYERVVAPLYCWAQQGISSSPLASFFQAGGQQLLYLQDMLTLEAGWKSPQQPIPIPPPDICYPNDLKDMPPIVDWKRAYLCPLQVPEGTPELSTLAQDEGLVLQAVRQGFAAALDVFVPALHHYAQEQHAKLAVSDGNAPYYNLLMEYSSDQIAKWVFPSSEALSSTWNTPKQVAGDSILDCPRCMDRRKQLVDPVVADHPVLSAMPGFADAKLHHLAQGLVLSLMNDETTIKR